MNLSRTYAIVFGLVYTLVGVLGFAVTGTSQEVHTLIIFPVNLLHNVVHLAFGLAGIAAFATNRTVEYARVAAVLFAVLVLGGIIQQASGAEQFLGLVPLAGTDIFLHAATAILAAAAGWAYATNRNTTTA